ncbi:MAG TPA: response regulator [Burkholderiales bacterium]|nr:response regulator [Burkholderiales bacterium]
MDRRPIVLVEDNEDDEVFALHAFQKSGIPNAVVVARDGQQALDRLLDPDAELPAFVLLDLKLPKVSGLEVLKRLRADPRTRFVPVITLTSSTHEADMRASYELGANSYICKSLDIETFTEHMSLLARYWTSVNMAIPD